MSVRTDCKSVFFISSSGHCSLDCVYCIINPVVKHQPSLNFEDIRFLVDSVGNRSLLAFSGKGDFFAGYKKNDRLLESVLSLDVEVALDVNAVMIHEFPEIADELLRKIRYVNMTMHYRQLKDKNALAVWKKNVEIVIRRMRAVGVLQENTSADEEGLLVDFVASPLEASLWNEALDFYRENIFAVTGQKLVVVRDVNIAFDSDYGSRFDALCERYDDMLKYSHSEDFAAKFAKYPYVDCPAGVDYFRVWNDGAIEGCPYIDERKQCGNVKERKFVRYEKNFRCSTPKYCDCSLIAMIGKMDYPSTSSGQA